MPGNLAITRFLTNPTDGSGQPSHTAFCGEDFLKHSQVIPRGFPLRAITKFAA